MKLFVWRYAWHNIAMLCACLIFVFAFAGTASATPSIIHPPTPGSYLLIKNGSAALSAVVSSGVPTNLPSVNYDEQIYQTFYGNDFGYMESNVIAVAQNDVYGYGPDYLLNGYSNLGYWYQVGLAYNWPASNTYIPGFTMGYDVFAPNGIVVWPNCNDCGGIVNFNGNVNPNDIIELKLNFSNGDVILSAYDLNTSAYASTSYPSFGANQFLGAPYSGGSYSATNNGFFTGPMTEWYHVNPYYGTELNQTYNESEYKSGSSIGCDEYKVSSESLLFFNFSSQFGYPSPIESFFCSGLMAYLHTNSFQSGSLPLARPNLYEDNALISGVPTYDLGQKITFSENIVGGISPYVANFIVYNAVSENEVFHDSNSNVQSGIFTNTINTTAMGVGTYDASFFATTNSAYPLSDVYSATTANFIINAPLGVNVILGSSNALSPILSGRQITMYANAYGGTSPYTYNFIVSNSLGILTYTGAQASNSTTIDLSELSAGNYIANVVVSDSASMAAYANSIGMPFNILPSLSSAPLGLPSANIVAYAPITLLNSQGSAVAANTSIAIVYNAMEYARYETPNLNNSEFFFANGSLANAWLQGPIIAGGPIYNALRSTVLNGYHTQVPYLNASINSSALSVTSPNALSTYPAILWWVKIPSNSFLKAYGTNIIYLGWAGNTITPANILMNGVSTGEAPQLSKEYGKYDNGGRVFLYYSPEYNISDYLPSGSDYNSVLLSQIQTPYGMTQNAVDLTYGDWAGTQFTGMAWINRSILGDNIIMEGWTPEMSGASGNTPLGGQFAFRGNSANLSYAYSTGVSPSGPFIFYDYPAEVNGAPISENAYSNSSYTNMGLQWIWNYAYVSGNTISESMYPYPPDPFGGGEALILNQTVTNSILGPDDSYIGLGGQHTGATGAYYYGVRARIYPPNGFMPYVSFGGVITTPSEQAVISQPSNAIADVGEYETFTATVAGGSPPYNYDFFAVSSQNPSTIVNSIEFNGVMSTSKSWTIPVLSQDISSAPIVANVIITPTGANSIVSPYSPTPYYINSALGIPTISSTTLNTIDIGQNIKLSSYVSGGTMPYTYEFGIYNSVNGLKVGEVVSLSNSVLWDVNNVSANDVLVANVLVLDAASSPVAENSAYAANSFYVYPQLFGQHIYPINASNLSSSYSLCAGAPGYSSYSDPGLRAGAAWIAQNYYIRCFRQDIPIQNSTTEGIDAFLAKQYGVQFMGILDYATVDSYLRQKMDCAYTSCNYSSPHYTQWNLTDWNNSVREALAEYPEVNWWEIWNEPDNYLSGYQNHSALNYFRMIASAANIIHSERPNDTVICFGGDGGGSVYYPSSAYQWWQQVWDYGASPYCNAVSVHYDYSEPKASFSSIWNLTGKPIWESEIGVSTANQLQYIDWMLGDFNSAFGASTHFKKLNWLASLSPGFQNWGLIQNYPYTFTPQLRNFTNFSNTFMLYNQSVLQFEPGQLVPFSVYAQGGNPPYTYNFSVYSISSNSMVANMLSTSNTFVYTIPSSLEGKTLVANVIITDRNGMKVNSSLSDVIAVSNTLGCGASCAPNVVVSQNPTVYKTFDFIYATPNPYTDNIDLVVNNIVVASGSGTISYDANALAVGNYLVYATDLSNDENSIAINLNVNNTLSVAAPFPRTQNISYGYNKSSGDSAIIIAYNASGGSPPYHFQWLEQAPGASGYSNSIDCMNGSFNTWGSDTEYCQFNTNSLTVSGTYNFKLEAIDSKSNSIYSAPINVIVGSPAYITTSTTTLTTTIPQVGGGGGGGGGASSGSGGGGGGGGAFLPTVVKEPNGYMIYNLSDYNSESVKINGINFGLRVNYITPNYAGVTINNHTYQLTPKVNYTILNQSMYSYYAIVENLSYIPAVDTINMGIFYKLNSNSTYLTNRYKFKNNTSINATEQLIELSSGYIYFNHNLTNIALTSPSNESVKVNANLEALNANAIPHGFDTKIMALNISAEPFVHLNLTTQYVCDSSNSSVGAFESENGVWMPIESAGIYSIKGKCFAYAIAPNNGIIGIFGSTYIHPPSELNTTITNSIAPAGTAKTNASSAKAAQSNSQTFVNPKQYLGYLIVLIGIIVVLLFARNIIAAKRGTQKPEAQISAPNSAGATVDLENQNIQIQAAQEISAPNSQSQTPDNSQSNPQAASSQANAPTPNDQNQQVQDNSAASSNGSANATSPKPNDQNQQVQDNSAATSQVTSDANAQTNDAQKPS